MTDVLWKCSRRAFPHCQFTRNIAMGLTFKGAPTTVIDASLIPNDVVQWTYKSVYMTVVNNATIPVSSHHSGGIL